MRQRILSFLLILGVMGLMTFAHPFGVTGPASSTLVLGFMLLAGYCTGVILEKIALPRITGYIFAGLLFGPYILKFYDHESVKALGFLNSLALAFIAFCAGGELRLENLRSKLKSILYLITGGTLMIFAGVTLVVFSISGFIPFMSEQTLVMRLAISSIFGVIAVARSPSSAIAIISETRAKGDYTDTVLSVTIATDVVIIMLFAVVVSACELVMTAGGTISVAFFLELLLEIVIALVLGFLLGKLMILLIEKVKMEFPVVITAMGFLVIKFSHLLDDYLDAHEINLQLEPILICMVAGFTVQNFSSHGHTFLERMERLSFPVYIGFFVITGSNINVEVLKSAWFFGLVVVVARIAVLFGSSYLSGKLSGDPPRIYRNTWLSFITQAGVSLGLLAEVVRRFPEMGVQIQTILVAAITINQIVGPVAMKYILNKVGEAGAEST